MRSGTRPTAAGLLLGSRAPTLAVVNSIPALSAARPCPLRRRRRHAFRHSASRIPRPKTHKSAPRCVLPDMCFLRSVPRANLQPSAVAGEYSSDTLLSPVRLAWSLRSLFPGAAAADCCGPQVGRPQEMVNKWRLGVFSGRAREPQKRGPSRAHPVFFMRVPVCAVGWPPAKSTCPTQYLPDAIS